jgi:hypothetical protein
MRLLFWKKKEKVNKEMPTPVRSAKRTNTPNVTSQNVPTTTVPQKNGQAKVVKLKKPVDTNARELAPLKAWCDINLNPLAWSRIVIRMLPVFRDFNQNLSEMQKPRPSTVVEQDLHLLILATIQEIYGVEPQILSKKKLA